MSFSLEELKVKAKSGDGLSAYLLGRSFYSQENCAPLDYQESYKWYKLGYEKLNDSRCQYGFAMFYYDDGESEPEGIVEKDNEYANQLFKNAYPKLIELAKTDMYANFILGAYHNYGIGGMKKDFSKALNFIEKSAELGHSGACYDMGKFYLEGRGVKKNVEKAKFYLEKASLSNNKRATELLKTINLTKQKD